MHADLIMVFGLLVMFFAFPAFVAAWSEGEAPRLAALFLMFGGALCFYATTIKPGGYSAMDVPMSFVNVAAMILN